MHLEDYGMDEDFEYFLAKFGPAIEHEPVSQVSFERFRGRLPNQLLEYWREFGWCGFARGLFWLVNPEVWDEPMERMLEETGFLEKDAYHVIARNAFGDMWLWGERTGASASVVSSYGMVFPRFNPMAFSRDGGDLSMRYFFSGKERDSVDLLDDKQKPLFDRALKKLGPLQSHEVYGFVPLLSAGGACQLKSLQKLDAQVHMAILADMTEMRVMPDYAAEARKQGLI
jgi:hypothetical protein